MAEYFALMKEIDFEYLYPGTPYAFYFTSSDPTIIQ